MAARSGRSSGALDDLALGIVGVGLDAPGHREHVGLAPVHDERHGLGRLAERDRQDARGERVERAGMAGLLGEERALHHRDRMRRRHADALVEHDPADARRASSGAARRCAGGRRAACSRSFIAHSLVGLVGSRACGCRGATFSVRRSASMRAASSKVSSRRKRRSGANFRLTRWATSCAEHLAVAVERLHHRALVLAAERHHVGGGELEVGRHAHLRDGDHMLGQHVVLDVAARRAPRRAHGARVRRRAAGAARGRLRIRNVWHGTRSPGSDRISGRPPSRRA